MKLLQNRIAESGLVLPVMLGYSMVVWMIAGLLTHSWWPQFVCLVLSAYVMVEMSTTFALLRIRSRMVSGVFIALSCTMSFLFGSLSGGLVQLFFVMGLLLLLTTYQNEQMRGRIFYAFVLFGLSSVLSAHLLLFVPLLWVLMGTQLQSLTWRGWMASVIGLLTPYWFLSVWFIYQRDFTPLANHFSSLMAFSPLPATYLKLSVAHWMAYVLILALTVTGIVHFWRNSIDEKIRTRLIYGLFTSLTVACLLLTLLQPQLYDPLMRLAVVCASPFIAHFLTLTSSRITNIAFFVILAVILAVTVGNLF